MFRRYGLDHMPPVATVWLANVGLLLGNASAAPAGLEAQVGLNRTWAERAFSDRQAGDLPFSFVYSGKPSSELLPTWKCDATLEPADQGKLKRIVTLTDPRTGLEIKAVVTIYTDTPGVDWTLQFTNRGSQDTPIIEEVKPLDMALPVGQAGQALVLHRLNGALCRADDWLPFDQALPPGQKIPFAAINGRSSNVCPFFNVDWGSGGVITAIGWSGQWTAAVQHDPAGNLHIQAGMERMHLTLHPGETIRSPRILQLQWSGDDPLESYNLFRKTMFAHIMVRIDGQLVWPPIAHMSTSFYELNDSNEANVLAHLESIRGLGFDTFWLDAYWTGPSGFPNSMGNYGLPIERVEPKDRFPHGLIAISDAVEKAGLKFLLWFEPERVAAGTLIAKEHPEWVISPSGDGSGLYNLGDPQARQYMTDYLNAAVKAYKVSCLRIDYNIDPLAFWQFMDVKDPNRVGMSEIRYVEGLYRMWDDLLRSNPKLYIDDCASGGRRIDLETLSRSLPLWRSDNTCDMLDHNPATVVACALKNQVMSAGLNRYVPFSTVGQMGATPYLFRSGFNAGIPFGEDVRPKEYPRALLKQAIAEGHRIRKYYLGDYYPLAPVTMSPKDWCVMQYHRSDAQDGMVVAFRRPASSESGLVLTGLRGIDAAAQYQVTKSWSYTPVEPVLMTGSALKALMLQIDDAPGSVIVEYRKVAGR